MENKNILCLLKQPNNAVFVWLFHYKNVPLHQEKIIKNEIHQE